VEKNSSMTNERKEIFDTLSVHDIIYAEVAEYGAMGCAGQIMFYTIKDEQLVYYETFIDEEDGIFLEKLLFSHQDSIEYDNIQPKEVLFNYYYGGFGNHVFINKNVLLEIVDAYFVYKNNNKEYYIHSSVSSVFERVASALQETSKT